MAIVIAKMETITENTLKEIQILDKKDKFLILPTNGEKGIPFILFPVFKQMRCEIEFLQTIPGENEMALPFMLGYLYATNKDNMYLLGFEEETQVKLPLLDDGQIVFVKTVKELIRNLDKTLQNKDKAERPKRVKKVKKEEAADLLGEIVNESLPKSEVKKVYPKHFVDLMKNANVTELDTVAECIVAASDYKFGLPIQLEIRGIDKDKMERILLVLSNGNYETIKQLLEIGGKA